MLAVIESIFSSLALTDDRVGVSHLKLRFSVFSTTDLQDVNIQAFDIVQVQWNQPFTRTKMNKLISDTANEGSHFLPILRPFFVTKVYFFTIISFHLVKFISIRLFLELRYPFRLSVTVLSSIQSISTRYTQRGRITTSAKLTETLSTLSPYIRNMSLLTKVQKLKTGCYSCDGGIWVQKLS